MEEEFLEEEEIFRAIREGDEGVVTRLLDADPALLERESWEWGPPLKAAAGLGRLRVVQLLVQRGANINRLAGLWIPTTALHTAAFGGHEEVAAYLLSNGAQASIRDGRGRTPLMSACDQGHLGVVQMLLQHTGGQELDDVDAGGMMALHIAASEGREEVVDLLLSKGAQAGIRDDIGMTPFMWAALRGHLGVVQMLVRHRVGQGLDDRDASRSTALHNAAKWDRAEVVRFALLAGANPTMRDYEGRTPRTLAEEGEEWTHDGSAAGRARCVTVFDWWDGELERRYVLHKATCLHKAHTTQRDQPTSQVPTYLEARVAAGHAVPGVEVVLSQSEEQCEQEEGDNVDASGKRKAAGEGGNAQGVEAEGKEREAVLEYVMQGLNEELLTELLEGFHSASIPESDQEEEEEEDEEEV